LATEAIVVHDGKAGPKELRLRRILDFFGVPCKTVDVSERANTNWSSPDCAILGSVQTVASIVNQFEEGSRIDSRPTGAYAYADENRNLTTRALQSLFGDAHLSLQDAPAGNLSLCVCNEDDIAGPMAGLRVSTQLRSEDAVLSSAPSGGESKFETVISAGGAPVFLRSGKKTSAFFCTSSQIVDIDEPVGPGFYDVKAHFCSVVPLVMFIRFMFPTVSWRPQELGACLIIDDPLLRPRYGFCDFAKLRDLMRRYGFTTNIAFIPWNWRRTSAADADFFRNETELFSVSIHGCDHTAGEFGTNLLEVLHSRARLAQTRMRSHAARTGIRHEPIMVFPQGAFSSACPEALKHTGFLAAVNTETVPVDSRNARTRIRDVWDVAIMTYGGFPIFTRRYAFHGLENFAFDLLLGKPCLIVAHHDFFKDGGVGLIELIEKIAALNCTLRWRPLGDIIRRACRYRANGINAEEVEMYGNELIIGNVSDQTIEVKVRKRTSQDDLIAEIVCDEKAVVWAIEDEHLLFGERIQPHSEKCFRVVYQEHAHAAQASRSLRFEMAVAARRVLSEFRDVYLSRSDFLSSQAGRLKNALKKAI